MSSPSYSEHEASVLNSVEEDLTGSKGPSSLFVHDTPSPGSIKDEQEITGNATGDQDTIVYDSKSEDAMSLATDGLGKATEDQDTAADDPELIMSDQSIIPLPGGNVQDLSFTQNTSDPVKDTTKETSTPVKDNQDNEPAKPSLDPATIQAKLKDRQREFAARFAAQHNDETASSREDSVHPEPSRLLFGEVMDDNDDMPVPSSSRLAIGPHKATTSAYITEKLHPFAQDNTPESSLDLGVDDNDRSSSSNSHGTTNSKDVSRKSKKSKKRKDSRDMQNSSQGSRKRKATASANAVDMSSLGRSNVFADQQRNAALPNPPMIADDRDRSRALQSYIRNALPEHKIAARRDCKVLNHAIRQFDGQGSVKANLEDGTWSVKGLHSGLMPHQAIACGLMRERERAVSGGVPSGILADEMGLGKTVMMLANIMNGLKESRACRGAPRTTLIVANRNILQQWQAELRRHCKSRDVDRRHGYGTVSEHYSGRRIALHDDEIIAKIEESEICFTTYSEISRSWPAADPPLELTTAEEKNEWWKAHFEENKGIFLRAGFHRVVLDEAHIIKNHESRISKACRHINAKHRWAITGTPIMNSVSELYPYFLFLKMPFTGSFQIFKENFCAPDDPEGCQRLAVILSKHMIRRTHGSTFAGSKLLALPKAEEIVLYLEFTEVERAIYDIVTQRFIEKVNSILLSTDSGANRCRHVWVLLLRLRQMTSHVLLLQETIIDLFTLEDYEKLNRVAMSVKRNSEPSDDRLLRQIALALETGHTETTNALGGSGHTQVMQGSVDVPPSNPASSTTSTGGSFGKSADFGRYISEVRSSTKWQEILGNAQCAACHQPPQDPMITSCFHIYCYLCVNRHQHDAARAGHAQAMCLICHTPYASVRKCLEALPRTGEETDNGEGTASNPRKPTTIPTWINMPGEMISSTKTRGVKMQLIKWLENPDIKVIVYTQFLDLLRILSRMCTDEGWSYVTYHGKMSHEARERAIVDFQSPEKNKQIMLAALKTGGLGLNLVMAARVLTIDPWWNSCTESQAFCRVFRIGQERTTQLCRLIVRNTIDEKMEAIKKRKDREINGLMDSPALTDTLKFDELLGLFGTVEHDTAGRPFIVANSEVQGRLGQPGGTSIANQLNVEGTWRNEE